MTDISTPAAPNLRGSETSNEQLQRPNKLHGPCYTVHLNKTNSGDPGSHINRKRCSPPCFFAELQTSIHVPECRASLFWTDGQNQKWKRADVSMFPSQQFETQTNVFYCINISILNWPLGPLIYLFLLLTCCFWKNSYSFVKLQFISQMILTWAEAENWDSSCPWCVISSCNAPEMLWWFQWRSTEETRLLVTCWCCFCDSSGV